MADADPWAEFRGAAAMPLSDDPWADFRAPHQQDVPVLPDVAKSAGVGVAKGVIGIPGLPGNIVGLIDSGLKKLYSMAGMTPEEIGAIQDHMAQVRATQGKLPFGLNETIGISNKGGANPPPTSGDIQAAVEPYTGKFYEPQTKAGRYAETVGEFAPLALATGGEGPVANVIKGAVAPGLASEAAGEYTKGSALETPARIIAGIAGGLGAHAGQTGLNAAATAGAARSAAREAGDLVGDPAMTSGAISRVAKDVRNDQLTPAYAGMRMSQLGPEGMMLDAGRQLQGRAEAIATQPGVGQNRVLDAVENRTGPFGAGTAQRIKDTLNTAMGASPDVVATTKQVADIVDRQAKPLYDAVMNAHPDVGVPADIAARPAVRQAMRDAESIAKNYNEPLSRPVPQTTLNAGGVPVTQTVQQPTFDLRYWDNVKKAMDSRISGMLKTGGIQALDSAEKADLGGLIAARNALRDHLDTETGGAYASARQVAATKPQLTEALEQGQQALKTTLLPEELKDIHDNMSIPQQAMLRMGMRREVERIIDTARNDGAAARRILDTNQNREKIAEIFGQPAADAIDNRIAAETKFQEATNKISANSRTGVRQQLVKDTESPSAGAPPMANLTGFATKGVTSAMQALRDSGMERTRAAIGSLMTAPANQVPDLVRILAGYNARAAANARPPVGPTLSTLGRVLAINEAQRQGGQKREPLRLTVGPRQGYLPPLSGM